MLFLFSELVGLLLLAASFGGTLAWWWLNLGREDVTERYDALEKLVSTRSEPGPVPASAADLAPVLARLETLSAAVDELARQLAAPEPPPPPAAAPAPSPVAVHLVT